MYKDTQIRFFVIRQNETLWFNVSKTKQVTGKTIISSDRTKWALFENMLVLLLGFVYEYTNDSENSI